LDPVLISPSQYGVWDRCEFAWFINYKLGFVPSKKKDYFQVGTCCHELLAIFYGGKRDGVDPKTIWNTIVEYAQSRLSQDNLSADDVTAWKRSLRIVRRYITEWAPIKDEFRILEVERHFVVKMLTPKGREFELQGYTDLLIELRGKIYLFDHKTVGQKKWWTQLQADMDPQMGLYTLGLRREGYKVHGVIINQLNTYDYKDWESKPLTDLYYRLETYRTETQLDNIARHIGKAVDEIIDRGDSGDYRKSLRKDCERCPYVEPCLYDLKGINPMGLLQSPVFLRRDTRTQETLAADPSEHESVESYALDF